MTDENIPEWAAEALPETLRDIPFLKDTESPEAFKTKLTEAAQYMGNSMRIPGPDAGEADWGTFKEKLQSKVPGLIKADLESDEGRMELFKMLGRPDEVSEYGAEGDASWLADVAHKAGLTKNQFAELVKGVGETNIARKDERTAEQQEAIDALYSEWGLSKVKKLEHIEGLAKLTNAPEEFVAQLKDGTVDASTLRWMDGIAQQFADAAKFSADRNDPDALTPVEAQSQIQELLNNPEYFSDNAIGRSLQKKMVELQKAANPGISTSLDNARADNSFLEMFREN